MDWLKERAKERTTWLGLATVLTGVGQLAKVEEAPLIADTVAQVGTVVTGGGWDLPTIATIILGAVITGMREKGRK